MHEKPCFCSRVIYINKKRSLQVKKIQHMRCDTMQTALTKCTVDFTLYYLAMTYPRSRPNNDNMNHKFVYSQMYSVQIVTLLVSICFCITIFRRIKLTNEMLVDWRSVILRQSRIDLTIWSFKEIKVKNWQQIYVKVNK